MARKKRDQQPTINELPLEETYEETMAPNGDYVFRRRFTRGVLELDLQKRVRLEKYGPRHRCPPSAKARLELIAGGMRALLRLAKCPTDHEYVWISIAGGDWKHDSDPDSDLRGQPYELRSWHEQLTDVTEPLSTNRLRGDLLHAIDKLLQRELRTDLLENILELMKAYAAVRISGSINELATRGAQSKKSLAAGPQARKARARDTLELVCRHAENFWRRKAALRGEITITGDEIASEINAERSSLGLKPLRPKTITDYISKGISGGLLRVGQS